MIHLINHRRRHLLLLMPLPLPLFSPYYLLLSAMLIQVVLLVFFALVFGRAENPKMEVDPVPLSETWAAMEELVDAGLAKDIGVSNFNCQLLADLLSYARIKPSVNQVHC